MIRERQVKNEEERRWLNKEKCSSTLPFSECLKVLQFNNL